MSCILDQNQPLGFYSLDVTYIRCSNICMGGMLPPCQVVLGEFHYTFHSWWVGDEKKLHHCARKFAQTIRTWGVYSVWREAPLNNMQILQTAEPKEDVTVWTGARWSNFHQIDVDSIFTRPVLPTLLYSDVRCSEIYHCNRYSIFNIWEYFYFFYRPSELL